MLTEVDAAGAATSATADLVLEVKQLLRVQLLVPKDGKLVTPPLALPGAGATTGLVAAARSSLPLSGNPNGAGAVVVPEYWPGAAILDLNVTGSRVIPDPNNNVRCRWWQEALYY